ncbi:MAG TPA: alpha/beta fold hydrolase [Caulobacteraceae bacterium]|nr:alpha/beta fold hydrolase [Caulobacteraceae bacterium]
MRLIGRACAALVCLAGVLLAGAGEAKDYLGVKCETPPPLHCATRPCELADFTAVLANQGNAIEPKTGRRYFLDYPCDLAPGDKVTFILSLHGAGSIGNWQRHYFPAMDYKEQDRLVIATPTAATMSSIFPGAPPTRIWVGDADDQYLHNIVDEVIGAFGKENIRAFWLAGHSQGGMTANRIVCTPFFAGKVDGWLSLSGGRIGPAEISPDFFPPMPPGAKRPAFPRPAQPTCDFNFIFETGQHEIIALPATSPWADRYHCAAREREADVADDQPGYVWDPRPRPGGPSKAWGGLPRPGTAQVWVYPKCDGGRLVADVVRLDKGHTEGLEPNVTETLIKMMVTAPGGALQRQP